jgi:hypothetical protein
MNNEKDISLVLEEQDIKEECCLSVDINKYKLINEEFVKSMDKIDEIIENENITQSDLDFIENLDIDYNPISLSENIIEKHGSEIYKTILEATLSESFEKTLVFFDDFYSETFKEKLGKYKIKFIQLGIETDFILDFVAKLESNLNKMRKDFQIYVFSDFKVDLFEIYPITAIIEKANDEPDLLKRKQIFVDTIADCDLYCLELNLSPEEEKNHQLIIGKCKKAIKVLDNQIYHSSNENSFNKVIIKNDESKIINPINELVINTETNNTKLASQLKEFGFYEVPKVKILPKEKQAGLIELLETNKLPYCIAMFNYLGYLKYLRVNHFKTDIQRNTEIASWFDIDERSVKGNISVLDEYSGENKKRYTAHNFKEIVEKDYTEIK